jgi:hypothetical protein
MLEKLYVRGVFPYRYDPSVFMSGLPSMMYQMASAFSARNLGKQAFLNVIRAGTICRTIVWPCIPPLMLYQYIRQKDEDYFALELLRSRGEIKDASAVFDAKKPGSVGHWKIQDDLELIRSAVNDSQ